MVKTHMLYFLHILIRTMRILFGDSKSYVFLGAWFLLRTFLFLGDVCKMRKIFALLLTLVLIISAVPLGVFDFNVSAATDGYYTYTVSNGEATITKVDSSISGEITLPDTLGTYCVTSIGYGAFRNNTCLTSIDIPNSVVNIGNYVFSGCSQLESINFGNGVKTIGMGVFSNCINLKNVTIPKSVVSIADNAFVNCFGLEEIEVDIDNDYYHSVDGVLFDKNVTNLIKYPAKKKDVSYTILDTVERIGAQAFYECEFLENITISKSVVQIESSALTIRSLKQINVVDGNSGFCDINGVLFDKNATTLLKYPAGNSISLYEVPNSVKNIGPYAFEWCTSLTSIVIPNSVTTVSEGAFYVCKGLTSIIIPDSVINIGDSAFSNCSSLTSISVPSSVTYLGDRAFNYTAYYDDNSNWEGNALYIGKHLIKVQSTMSYDFIIKDGTISISSNAFSDCTQLKNVTIPNSITRIGSSAFSNCCSLESITIPEGVTSIEYGTFMDCNSLTSVTIPKSVTSIGSSAFSYCSSLESITIPESVLEIGNSAFSYCPNLQNINIPKNITSIGTQVFMHCSSLESITIPESVLEIGMNAFAHCTNLQNINIPKNVTSIGIQAFMYCSSLESIIIPYGVSQIGYSTFSSCTSLKNINIPKSVTSIGDYAFSSCNNLTNVYYAGDENDAELINIGTVNKNLTNATWHYDSCFNSTSHTYSNDWIVVTYPTCISDGSKCIKCSICGDMIVESISKTNTHNWSKWTEELNGNYLRECNDCDAFETITIKEDKPINTTPTDNASNTILDNNNIELIEKVLTDEEQSEVANGAEVSVYLVVTDISENVSEDDKTQIETTTPDGTVGMYLDIDLFKKINTTETQVTETNSTVTVSIVIPNELINTDSSIKRTYNIVRIHNGVSEIIEGIFNFEDNTFTFETDKFSTYALIYTDEQISLLGDTNSDGLVNNRDLVLLMRHINGWDIQVNIDAADINHDGKINNKDYVYLMRKINGWENY